jgi:hypothetical protein
MTSLESGECCTQTILHADTRLSDCAPQSDIGDRITTRTRQSRDCVSQTEESAVLSGGAVCAGVWASTSRGAGTAEARTG